MKKQKKSNFASGFDRNRKMRQPENSPQQTYFAKRVHSVLHKAYRPSSEGKLARAKLTCLG